MFGIFFLNRILLRHAVYTMFWVFSNIVKNIEVDVFFKTSLKHRIVKQKVRCFMRCFSPGPTTPKMVRTYNIMPLWFNIACHASIFVNKLLEKTHCCHNLSQISKNLLQFFNSFKIVNKSIANMHREHDVLAFFEHRQKHRGQCFFQNIA